jgi:protein SCO1/2
MRRLSSALLFACIALPAPPANAALTPAQLGKVAIDLPKNAHLPLNEPFVTDTGTNTTLGKAFAGKPGLMVIADFTCKTLCGTAIAMAADAAGKSGLKPGEDFNFVVVGFDPRDHPSDAAAMKAAHIDDGAVKKDALFLSGSAAAEGAVTKAVGFSYTYDKADDVFAHPTAAFAIAPDGRVTQVLTSMNITSDKVRLALVAASKNRIGTITDHIRLLCYGLNPASGVYNASVLKWLRIGGFGIVGLLGFGIIGMLVMRREGRGRTG